MYFDFDDRYADVEPVGRAINLRDGVGVSIAVHAVIVALLFLAPAFLPERAEAPQDDIVSLERERPEEPRFVFVQPRMDTPAPKPPERAEMSDLDRMARTPERPPILENPLPAARGNSSERTEARNEERARGRGAAEEPAPPAPPVVETPPSEDPSTQGRTAMQQPQQPAQPPPGGRLGEALRNLQKYVDRESFDNQRGGGQEFGPLQFDTKGVEFGPWIRRFVSQVKRNWFVPYAAMSLRGRVVITFFVHKSGALTDVTIVSPSAVESFNLAARNALLASNPTEPLPPEYPDEKAFFTVTFFYNESPDGRTPQ